MGVPCKLSIFETWSRVRTRQSSAFRAVNNSSKINFTIIPHHVIFSLDFQHQTCPQGVSVRVGASHLRFSYFNPRSTWVLSALPAQSPVSSLTLILSRISALQNTWWVFFSSQSIEKSSGGVMWEGERRSPHVSCLGPIKTMVRTHLILLVASGYAR